MEGDNRLGSRPGTRRCTAMLHTVLQCARWLALSGVVVAFDASSAGDRTAGGTAEARDAGSESTGTPGDSSGDSEMHEVQGQSTGGAEATARDADMPGGVDQEPPDAAEAANENADMSEVADFGTDVSEPARRLPIIVNLAVGDGEGTQREGGGEALADVTARVMERLKPVMQAEDLAEVRTFGFLPAIALSADGALIARLLAMPEVQSIELDREFQPLGDAAGELPFD